MTEFHPFIKTKKSHQLRIGDMFIFQNNNRTVRGICQGVTHQPHQGTCEISYLDIFKVQVSYDKLEVASLSFREPANEISKKDCPGFQIKESRLVRRGDFVFQELVCLGVCDRSYKDVDKDELELTLEFTDGSVYRGKASGLTVVRYLTPSEVSLSYEYILNYLCRDIENPLNASPVVVYLPDLKQHRLIKELLVIEDVTGVLQAHTWALKGDVQDL